MCDDPPTRVEKEPHDHTLPAPQADGACDHLVGRRLPDIELPSTAGRPARLAELPARTVLFVYPSIGGPGDELLEEWTLLPGASGCTPEACSFRDLVAEFSAHGAGIAGLSSQSPSMQKVHQEELHLPYPLLSDAELTLSEDPGLPVFVFHGVRYFRRATLVVSDGLVEAALYPVFPPEEGAAQALERLRTTTPRA